MAMVRATAKVTVTVEVTPQSTWGLDSSVEQIRKATTAEAVNAVTRHLHTGGIKARVIGTPTVTVVTIDEAKEKY